MATQPIRQRVEVDTGDSVADLERVADAAEAVDEDLDAVDDREVTVDTGAALERLEAIDDELRRLRDEKTAIRAELDASGVDVDAVKRRLDELPEKRTVVVEADTSQASRALDDIGQKATPSVGPLRDVAGSFSGIGSGGLDAVEGIMGAGEAFATQNPRFEKAAAAVGAVAFQAGLVVVGTQILGAAYDALADKATNVEGKQEDLNAALAAGDLERAAAAAKELTDEYQKASLLSFGKRIFEGIPGFVDALGDLPALLDDSKARAKQLEEALGEGGPAAAQLLIDAFRRTGEVGDEEIGRYEARVRESMDALAFAADRQKQYAADQEVLNRAVAEGADIRDRSIDSLRREQEAHDLAADAAKRNKDATKDVADMLERLADPNLVIAPGYQPNLKVDVTTMLPTDTVALGRVVDQAIRDYYRASGISGYR